MTESDYLRREDPAETQRLVAALRAPEGWPKPPEGFAARCRTAIRAAETVVERHPRAAFARPWKIAASVALVAALTGFAAWMTGALLSDGEATEEAPVDRETEAISKEGKEMILARKAAGIVGAAIVSLSVGATEVESEPTFVFLRPETSSFWHTATNNVMTVPVDFPSGATSATLAITGYKYAQSYPGITDKSFTFTLPPAESPETENVYDLTLRFNDDAATVRTAKLGLVTSFAAGSEAVTSVIAPSEGNVWKAKGRAVLPIPCGTTSFTVDGVSTDTGLAGAQGWYALPLKSGGTTALSLTANGIDYSASFFGQPGGLFIIIR